MIKLTAIPMRFLCDYYAIREKIAAKLRENLCEIAPGSH